MADPFVAEVRVFGFNFPPKGWAFCDGQLLPISQNTALFSLLGTTYGGNGQSTFALPDCQGNCVIHPGTAPGGSLYDLGEMSGSQTVTLLESEMPAHSHSLLATGSPATASLPSAQTVLARSVSGSAYKASPFGTTTQMAFQALTPAGSSFPHNNMMPTLTLNYCIALQGVFPARP